LPVGNALSGRDGGTIGHPLRFSALIQADVSQAACQPHELALL